MSIAATSGSSAGGTPPLVDNGIVSGLNTPQIIAAMLTSYQDPITDLDNQQSTLNTQSADYQAINTDVEAFKTAAQTLSLQSGWGDAVATSSNSTAATATAASGTPAGSVAFNVLSLASADSVVSSGSVASTADVVDSNPTFLLAQGGAQYGFSTLAAGSGLTQGTHTIAVTQASAAAATTGTVGLGSQTSGILVGSGNNSVNVTVDGTSYSLTLGDSPAGGYSGSGLLSAVQSAISAAGASGVLQAGYNANGNLVLASTDQGSTQSLQVTGGTALSTLGLSTMASATNGADGVVTVDGTATTLSTVIPGSSVTLPSGDGGSITATLNASSSLSAVNSSLLSTGSVTATNVSTGSGSLSDVVANINQADVGIIASAVQTGTNQYILQLSSSTTGTAANLSVDSGAFSSSSLGSLRTATSGADAQIQVGGSGGYTLSSQTDTFAGLLPGLSVSVASTTTSPVTITVAPDAKGTSAAVQNLVTAANTVLSDISQYAGYNATTKVGGPLMGSAILENLQNQILGVFAATTGTSTLGNGENVGLTLDNGQINFDSSTFEKAFTANPSEVAAMFTQGGSFAPASSGDSGDVAFSYASPTTQSGSYNVTISHSATQASDLGSVLSGSAVSAAETLTVTAGSQSINYATTAGESLASVASGINSALAGAGLSLSAQVTNGGQQLELTSSGYGSASSFTVASSNTGAGTTGLGGATANTPTNFTGSDVVGTINGVTATGTGQYLSAPETDPTLGGLSLQVTASGITSSTSLGTFTYSPGIGQALTNLTTATSDPLTGSITLAAKSLTAESNSLNSKISFEQSLYNQEQKALQAEFSQLEVTLGTLKNQSTALSSALSGLSANG